MNLFLNYTNQENIILIYLLSLNIISFVIFGIDKWKAKNNKWRISENLLILISFIGGATGSLMGMVVFKHKLSKKKFYIGVPVFIVLNWIILIYMVNYIR